MWMVAHGHSYRNTSSDATKSATKAKKTLL